MTKKYLYIRRRDDFRTKTDNSDRIIPINDTLLEILQESKRKGLSERYLFCSAQGEKLSDRTLLQVAKRIGKAAGIQGRVFLHKFRHTFATQFLKRRGAIEALQKLLGHSTIMETMVYAHVRSEELHEEVALLNNLVELKPAAKNKEDKE